MALSIIQKASNSVGGADTVAATFSSPVTSSNTVLVMVSYASSGTFTSLTDDKSNSYTQVDTFTDATNSQTAKTFRCGNVTNGPTVVTLTLGAGTGFGLTIAIDEIGGGLVATDPTDGHTVNGQLTPGTGTDAVVSGNITTTANGDLIWGATSTAAGLTHALAGTGYTISNAGDFAPGACVSTESKIQTSAGSVQTTFTEAVSGYSICFVIAIQPPVVIPPPTATRMGAISL